MTNPVDRDSKQVRISTQHHAKLRALSTQDGINMRELLCILIDEAYANDVEAEADSDAELTAILDTIEV